MTYAEMKAKAAAIKYEDGPYIKPNAGAIYEDKAYKQPTQRGVWFELTLVIDYPQLKVYYFDKDGALIDTLDTRVWIPA